MKKLIIAAVVCISIFGLAIFFWVKQKNDLVNKQTLIPSFNTPDLPSGKVEQKSDLVNRETLIPRFSTPDLPSGKVGEYYEAELTGTLIGAKAELDIIGLEIPVGLNIDDCKQDFDIDLIPKPNTFIKCQLRGYPEKSEVFESSFELSAKDYTNRVVERFEIFITE